jgi:hypothetical protein
MAAMAAAPQMETPVATSRPVPGDRPRRRPISGVSTNVRPVAASTIATVRQPMASTSGTEIRRPSRTIATRNTGLDTSRRPGSSLSPTPPAAARAAPAATATTAGLSTGSSACTASASTTATAATSTPGRTEVREGVCSTMSSLRAVGARR